MLIRESNDTFAAKTEPTKTAIKVPLASIIMTGINLTYMIINNILRAPYQIITVESIVMKVIGVLGVALMLLGMITNRKKTDILCGIGAFIFSCTNLYSLFKGLEIYYIITGLVGCTAYALLGISFLVGKKEFSKPAKTISAIMLMVAFIASSLSSEINKNVALNSIDYNWGYYSIVYFLPTFLNLNMSLMMYVALLLYSPFDND